MKKIMQCAMGCISLLFIGASVVPAQQQRHQQMMMPRVPADKLEEAKALHNPLPPSPDVVEKGKVIYEGKGTCVNCHGASGHGDGPAGAVLNPPPRVFRSHGFWRHRSEGEIFWVIKHGVPGTGMIPFGGLLTDEEIWTVMHYERSFAGGPRGEGGPGHGPGRRGGRRGSSDMMQHREDHESQSGREGHRDGGDVAQSQALEEPMEQTSSKMERIEKAKSAAISMTQAIATANQQVTGTVIEAGFEIEGGQAFWEVEVATEDGPIMKVAIDSQSGAVLSSEEIQETSKKKGHKNRMRMRKGQQHGLEKEQECCGGAKTDHTHD
jgi:uncharacterized membrane protein YkoI/mono/diheme cytochrome c family protein